MILYLVENLKELSNPQFVESKPFIALDEEAGSSCDSIFRKLSIFVRGDFRW